MITYERLSYWLGQNTDSPHYHDHSRHGHRHDVTEPPNSDLNGNTIGPYGLDNEIVPRGLLDGSALGVSPELGPIRCHVCNSNPRINGTACLEPSNATLQECPEGSNGCWRIDQHVDYTQNQSDPLLTAHHYIIRQCARYGDPNKPCYLKAGFGGRQSVCFCQEDGCNSAHGLGSSLFGTVVSTGLAFLLINKSVL